MWPLSKVYSMEQDLLMVGIVVLLDFKLKKSSRCKYNVFQETLVAHTGRKTPLNSSKLHKLVCVYYRQLKEQSYRNCIKYCFRCHISNKTIMVS